MLAVSTSAITGCGCNNNKSSGSNTQKPGYTVVATEPDLKDENFGFYIINSKEVMLTKYYGSSSDIVIPDTFQNYQVSIIGHSVFNNDGIETITVPDTVTEIQDYAFASNVNLKSVKLSKNLQYLGTNVFFNCRSLESLELPATLKSIDSFAFCASGLKSITIPESDTLTSLPQFAFYQCPDLQEVVLPMTMTNIPEDAFNDCPDSLVLKVYKNSYAESYAKKCNLKYEIIEQSE